MWHPMIGNHIDIRQVHVPALHQPDEAEKALHEIKSMGFIDILFTRLLKHAKQTDSSSFGIKATMPQSSKEKQDDHPQSSKEKSRNR
jgi:hypothetical protein